MPGMSDNFDVTQTTQVLPLPDLPALNNRWTMRRKATLIFAVRSGRISIEEACRVYKLSVDELLAWERNLERYGILACVQRATRFTETTREEPGGCLSGSGTSPALPRCRTHRAIEKADLCCGRSIGAFPSSRIGAG